MEHFHVSRINCPVCEKAFNCHGAISSVTGPQMGDLSLCAFCGLLFTFGQLGELRPLTEAEVASLTLAEVADIARTREFLLNRPELREE